MKAPIPILIGLLVVGCGDLLPTPAEPAIEKAQNETPSKGDKKTSTKVKPVKDQDAVKSGISARASDRPDDWGETMRGGAEFYAASDVSDANINLTKKWYEVASKAWGNYGPLEFWIVGSSKAAAEELDKKYCDLRKQKDSTISLKHCLNRGHNFVSYAKEGNAGLNTRRNENEKWSGFIITMSAKFPGPEEEDYKSVVLHEYFHVYQHAHIHSRKRSERESMNQKNPWWGGRWR